MAKKDVFKGYSLDELKKFSLLLESFESIDILLKSVTNEIKKREDEKNSSLNVRFTMDMFKKYNMFYPDELRVLEINCIRNLQDLIDCDLNSLVGITESIKEKLEWTRSFYDMTCFENGKEKTKSNK